MKLAEVTSINVNRTKTEMEEFNRVLGGGVVPGSLVLIGGDPGIGKSTLLLQVSTQLSQVGTVLYVSGEESAQQIKLRAERLGDIDSEFYLYAETNMQSVRAEVERIQPDFLIIDSIQTIMSPEISGVQGSVSQVREVDSGALLQLAKTNNIAILYRRSCDQGRNLGWASYVGVIMVGYGALLSKGSVTIPSVS